MKHMSWLERQRLIKTIGVIGFVVLITFIGYLMGYIQNVFYPVLIPFQMIFWVIVAVVYYKRSHARLTSVLFGNKFSPMQFVIGILLFLASAAWAFILMFPYSIYVRESYITVTHTNITNNSGILTILFRVGLGEEFIFRGFYNDLLSTIVKKKWIVILMSSALFSLIHFHSAIWAVSPPGLVCNLIFTFTIGIMYSSVRFFNKNGTVFALALAHSLYWIFVPTIAKSL